MNVASLELCKELYELSGWGETFNYWEHSDSIPAGEPYLTQPELTRRYGLWSTQEVKKRYSAYDLGYLLRKLPPATHVIKRTDGWTAWASDGGSGRNSVEKQFDSHLEDAVCKLAIELFKQDVLTKEVI